MLQPAGMEGSVVPMRVAFHCFQNIMAVCVLPVGECPQHVIKLWATPKRCLGESSLSQPKACQRSTHSSLTAWIVALQSPKMSWRSPSFTSTDLAVVSLLSCPHSARKGSGCSPPPSSSPSWCLRLHPPASPKSLLTGTFPSSMNATVRLCLLELHQYIHLATRILIWTEYRDI